jgi:hypothetical protein
MFVQLSDCYTLPRYMFKCRPHSCGFPALLSLIMNSLFWCKVQWAVCFSFIGFFPFTWSALRARKNDLGRNRLRLFVLDPVPSTKYFVGIFFKFDVKFFTKRHGEKKCELPVIRFTDSHVSVKDTEQFLLCWPYLLTDFTGI